MDQNQQQEGITFFIRWGLIEWGLTGMLSAGFGIAGWVWHLADRVKTLENKVSNEVEEREVMRATIRNIGSALDRKIDDETQRLEGRMDKVTERLDEMREDLPSRGFIEGQLNNLQARLDRSMDVKLAGR